MADTAENITKIKVSDDMIYDFNIDIDGHQINKDRVLAALRALFMLVASLCTMFGFSVDLDGIYQTVLVILMAASMIWGYWKNNNWTKNSVTSQKIKNELKSASK